MKSLSVTIQMKATEQYFPVVLFIMLYKVVLSFSSGLWLKSRTKTIQINALQQSSFLVVLSDLQYLSKQYWGILRTFFSCLFF